MRHEKFCVSGLCLCLVVVVAGRWACARTLEVGPGKAFSRIEAAVGDAQRGDVIKVWPRAGGKAYRRVAVQMKTPGVTIEAARVDQRIAIDGSGYVYSGRGRVPRAIFQFDPSAGGCTLAGFDLSGAHNRWGNGAGVRINAANDITIRNCTIHDNDMGIMSNGELAKHTGARQWIIACRITHNGTTNHAGYNHNLYLGGSSAILRGCEIADSLTGHNLKSRCHLLWVEYCYIHGSANRELDLVDARGNTDVPNSDAVVLGCVIVKRGHLRGNKAVIHFGRDGRAERHGTLWLVHDTIITPYRNPVIQLSSRGTSVRLIDNVIKCGARRARLLQAFHGGDPTAIGGEGNRIAAAYGKAGARLNGKLMAWRKIEMPWEAGGITSAPLLCYVGVGKLEAVQTVAAGANSSVAAGEG